MIMYFFTLMEFYLVLYIHSATLTDQLYVQFQGNTKVFPGNF